MWFCRTISVSYTHLDVYKRQFFEGVNIVDPKTDIDKHRQEMGMVFQQFNLVPHMTIMKNLTIAPMKLQGVSQQNAEAEAMRLLDRVGLADRANAYPSQLSGCLLYTSRCV